MPLLTFQDGEHGHSHDGQNDDTLLKDMSNSSPEPDEEKVMFKNNGDDDEKAELQVCKYM